VPGDVSILFDSGMQNRASKTIMLTLDLFLWQSADVTLHRACA
jgi:hypothetical protein